MNDDSFLDDLARAAREERETDRWDERWDRLAAGTLSAEEEAELQALAASSEEARLAYEAFRPLGPQFEARVAKAIEAIEAIQGEPQAAAAEPPARVLPFRRRITPWLGGVLAAGVAACLVLLLSAPPPLPRYSLDVAGGDQALRGASGPATVRVLHPGSALEVTLRPPTRVSGRLTARWFVVRGGEVRELAARPEFSPGGAVHLYGTLGRDLAIEPGEWALWVVVGRPGKLLAPAVLGAHPTARSLHQAGWTALRDEAPLRVAAGG